MMVLANSDARASAYVTKESIREIIFAQSACWSKSLHKTTLLRGYTLLKNYHGVMF